MCDVKNSWGSTCHFIFLLGALVLVLILGLLPASKSIPKFARLAEQLYIVTNPNLFHNWYQLRVYHIAF